MKRVRVFSILLLIFLFALPIAAQEAPPSNGAGNGDSPERQMRFLRDPDPQYRSAAGFDLPRLFSLMAGFSFERLFGETFSGRAYLAGGRPDPGIDISGPDTDKEENAFFLTGSAGARWYLNGGFHDFQLRPLDGLFVGGGFTLAYEQGDADFERSGLPYEFTYSGLFFGPYLEAGFKWVTPWVKGLFFEPSLTTHILFGSFGIDWDGNELPDSEVDIRSPDPFIFTVTVGYAF